MNYFTFRPEGAEECSVTAFLRTGLSGSADGRKDAFPAVVICPGGGYDHISVREGEPAAREFFAAGYQAFVLHYSVEEKAKNMQPLLELAAAVAHIRKYAREWQVDKNKIAVCGFSAGGHLAASLGTLYDEEHFLKLWGREENVRPDAMVLCYPVITADEFAHVRSLKKVSGAEEGSEEYRYFGLDRHVDAKTPPAFLWHTAEDSNVYAENSLRMAAALSAAKVPFELHVFPQGKHGMSVCTAEVENPDPYNGRWVEWSIRWLNRTLGFEKR